MRLLPALLAAADGLNTLVPYAGLWYLMYLSLAVSWWLVVPLAILAGGFLVRAFIIFHDCGHGSFFKSRGANAVVGFITGLLTFVPAENASGTSYATLQFLVKDSDGAYDDADDTLGVSSAHGPSVGPTDPHADRLSAGPIPNEMAS
jgi:hypothetical protein